jgi:glycosyltransferase involved in cell wall biosynthesis
VHIAINGYFVGQETTGSGQYLTHLLRALLRMETGDRYTLFLPPGARRPAPLGARSETRSLEENGFLGATDQGPGPLESQVDYANLSAPISGENLAKLWLEQIAYPRACRAKGVDLSHVPYFASPLLTSTPTVVTVHDLIPMILPAYRGDLRVRLYTALVAHSARRAKAIVTDSMASRDDLIQLLGIPKRHVHVVYLAAEERFRPDPDTSEDSRLRGAYDLPKRFILYLGSYDQRRNLGALLQGFAIAVDELEQRGEEPPTLALAGNLPGEDTPFRPDPRSIARRLGIERHIRFLGRVPEGEKAGLYRAAEFFCFPSRYEGFGLTPLESMACGTPVIAADAASLPEIVGDGGILVDPDDVEGWAKALLSLWSDPDLVRRLRPRALAQAATFSWARAARETHAVYRTIFER